MDTDGKGKAGIQPVSALIFADEKLRTPELLAELAGQHASVTRRLAEQRPVLE